MAWLPFAGLALLVVFLFARRRRAQLEIGRSEPISTLHLAMSRKRTAKVRAALEAATSDLR